jgi:Na+/melibiose symporter-like transporter
MFFTAYRLDRERVTEIQAELVKRRAAQDPEPAADAVAGG